MTTITVNVDTFVDHQNIDTDEPWKDKETLKELYLDKKLSVPLLANIHRVSETTIRYWLNKHGINQREDTCREKELELLYTHHGFDLDKIVALLSTTRRSVCRDLIAYGIADATEIDVSPYFYLDANLLDYLYNTRRYSSKKIATRFEFSETTVRNWLKKHGISTQDRVDRPWHDRDTLKEKYVVEKKSPNEIATEFDCSPKTITKWIKQFDLCTDTSDELSAAPWQDAETLKKAYLVEQKNPKEIAEKFDVQTQTIEKWLRKHGITRYTESELLEWINSFGSMFGAVPSKPDMNNWPGPDFEIYQYRFGSYQNAIASAKEYSQR